MNIGIFGITGNPPHLGHFKVLNKASQSLDEVWVSPVFNHAFGKKFLDYDLRVEMINGMLNDLPVSNVYLKHLDKEYFDKFSETVYSYKLLTYLKNTFPEHEFKLIIGDDNFKPEIWNKFFKHQEILDEFGVVVIDDQGEHSTDIRNMLKNNQNIVQLVSPTVLKIIQEKNLYKE